MLPDSLIPKVNQELEICHFNLVVIILLWGTQGHLWLTRDQVHSQGPLDTKQICPFSDIQNRAERLVFSFTKLDKSRWNSPGGAENSKTAFFLYLINILIYKLRLSDKYKF